MEGSKVRLSDIAEKLGVSTVTVSKAIADKEGVGDELREKIKQVALEMGYKQKASRATGAKSENSTGNIGIVIPARFFERNVSFYWNLYNAISRELLCNGYYAIMEQLDPEDEKNLAVPHIVQDKKVDGIIMLGQVSNEYGEFFCREYSNFIFLDFYSCDQNVDSVTTDNFYSEYVMTQYLIKQGHRDIRFVGNFNATASITDRFMGFMKAMLEKGLKVCVEDIVDDRDSTGAFIPIKLPDNMPTAFVCNCDETAARLIAALKEHNYRVPEDVSVAGFDNYLSEGASVPALTTIAVDPATTAGTAVELLLKKISGQPYNHGHTVLGGRLIVRDSVKSI